MVNGARTCTQDCMHYGMCATIKKSRINIYMYIVYNNNMRNTFRRDGSVFNGLWLPIFYECDDLFLGLR